jgi:hypothetical protein
MPGEPCRRQLAKALIAQTTVSQNEAMVAEGHANKVHIHSSLSCLSGEPVRRPRRNKMISFSD